MLPPSPTTRGFQFSLRHLFLAMVALSVLFALLFATPRWVTTTSAIVISTIAMATLTTAIVYGRGDLRGFCIGAIFPASLTIVAVACLFVVLVFTAFDDGYDGMFGQLRRVSGGIRSAIIFGIVLSPITGAVSVIVRRCLSRGE